MKAVILAGGKGTRLAPYTTVIPKPLLPVGKMPILEIIIKQLTHYGLKDIVLSVGYLSELIQAYFQNYQAAHKDSSISYVKEKEPLGTAGSLALVGDLSETFLVMNGDVLTSLDYSKLIEFHKKSRALLTIAVNKKEVRLDLGVVVMGKDGRVKDYLEKPVNTYFDSMGIYVYEPEVLKYIEKDVYLDLPTLVKRLVKNGEKVAGYLHEKAYYWIDMGQPKDYQKANEEFEKRMKEFLPE